MEDETSEGKLAIGIGVLVVTAAVAIVCPAVLGAAAATVTQFIATSALVGSAISGIMNGTASVKAGKSFFDGFASGVEEGAIIGALCGMFGAGTAVMMTGAEMTVGNVFAARVINAVGDATIGTATYIYHENKYDKAITGGDVAKTWAECAITSFVLRSVFEGGKSSSKADGKNRGMSTSKGRVESESSIICEGGSETSWYKADGTINYPPNNGAVPGTEVNMSLKPGDTFGRYGNIGNKSNFVTQTGANADKLALPPTTDPNIYQEFRVIKEIPNTIQAEIAAWGGSAGGGLQYELPMPILQLIREGYIVPK